MLDEEKRNVIVHCPDCLSQYDLTSETASELKVRCPRCGAVFPVASAVGSRLGPPPEPVPGVRRKEKITDPQLARRLARNMLSEVVLNRPGDKEKALRDQALLSLFGSAIMAAYQVYGSKVSPQLTGSREIFCEAVNEVLGDGVQIL